MSSPTERRRGTARIMIELALVVCAGSTLGAALNAVSRHPASLLHPVYPSSASGPAECSSLPGPGAAARVGTMTQAEAVAACGACTAAFVDARGSSAFAHGHVPGAIHLPPIGRVEEGAAIEPLRAFGVVVVYDEGAGCELARGVAERLVSSGLRDVRVLEGGWGTWQADGSPAQSGACAECAGPTRDGSEGVSTVSGPVSEPGS